MKYFDKPFLQFFKDLAANHNREWFQANKKTYELVVKKPFEIFVGDLIKAVAKHDKSVMIKPSEAIFRINRDIRFSKDKSPYKLYVSAIVSKHGRKSVGDPGIYLELGPEKLGLAGGAYMPEKENLELIRENIAANPKAFMKLLNEKSFKDKWGELQGEKNKVLPAEFKKAAEDCPYIYHKQYYYWAELKPSRIVSDNLLETIMEHYKVAIPVAAFIAKAFK